MPLRLLSREPAGFAAQRRLEKRPDRGRERLGVLRRVDDRAGPPRNHQLGAARLPAHHHRQARRHRLEHGVAEGVEAARKHQAVGRREQALGIAAHAREVHALRDAERARELARAPRTGRSIAPEHERVHTGKSAQRGEQGGQALAPEVAADEGEQRRRGG